MPTIPVALIQFDARPEDVSGNLGRMRDLTQRAVEQGARWVVFHEGTLCDYTPRLADLAEPVPAGPATASLDAAGSLGSLTGSDHLPSPQAPIIHAQPNRSIRVSYGRNLPTGNHAERTRCTCPTAKTNRRCFSPPRLSAIRRCVLYCRFLL